MVVRAEDLRWGSYKEWEGPWYPGRCRFKEPKNPTDQEKYLAVTTATEGGAYDAENSYDRMIVSVGLIQWAEAGQFSVTRLLGECFLQDPKLLAPLSEIMRDTEATLRRNTLGAWRFYVRGSEVATVSQQSALFRGKASGLLGSWDAASKLRIQRWAAGVASVFQHEAAQRIQLAYTLPRMRSFVLRPSQAILWGPDTPKEDVGLYGALRAAHISFSANLQTHADESFRRAVRESKAQKWSEDWVADALEGLVLGSGIAIYPHRYRTIRPVLERLYGVDLPDSIEPQSSLADPVVMQRALIALGFDLGPRGADGQVGPRTREALRLFQTRANLTADGVFGPLTRAAMEKELLGKGISVT